MIFNKIKKIIVILFDLLINLYFIFLLGSFVTDYSFILKDGVSNLSIHGLIFVFLLGVRWFIDKESFADSAFIKLTKFITKLKDTKLLFLTFVFLAFIIFIIGLFRHFAFSSSGIDLGVTDQSVWNTTQGRLLFSSLDGHISHLGAHFEPILFLIAPFYFVWPNILVLVVLHAFAIAVAVFLLYLIAKSRLNNRFLVFAFILAYFLSRPLRGVGLLDFHTDVFLIPLSFLSYYLLTAKRTFWAVFTLILMLACKENAAVLVFAFGIFTITALRRYFLGAALLVLSIAWWALAANLLMPYFAHTQGYPYLQWLPFGTTYAQNFSAIIKNPALLVNLFFSHDKIGFYLKLFLPLAMFSFLSPAHYVLFLFPLAFQVVAGVNHAGMVSITAHYPAHTLPFIFISAIFGAGKLIDFFENNNFIKKFPAQKAGNFLAVLIILLSLGFFGKSDGHKLWKFIDSAKALNSSQIRQALKIIPEKASVCATHRIVPHLSHRKYIYIWEISQDTRYLVEYVVLHRQLFERDKAQFEQAISHLQEKGFQEIYSDKRGDLFIFFNPQYNEKLLDNIKGRLISL